MAGGTFITQNKVRPGFYHKFAANVSNKNLFSEIGIAGLPVALNWGTADEMIILEATDSEETFLKKIGYGRDEVVPIREALKRAQKLLLYRVNGQGVKASLDMTPQPIIATARYAGERGNDIRVAIEEETVGGNTYIVKTYVGSILREEQGNIQNAEDVKDNDWVQFAGTGAITAAAGGSLVNGTNSVPAMNDYAQFLLLLEAYDCNAFGTMSTDTDIQELFIQETKKRIDELGKMGQCVLCDAKSDHEAIISVANGVVLRDGSIIDKQLVVAWVIGATAAAGPAKSLTYTVYEGAMAPYDRLNAQQIKEAIEQGQIVFSAQQDKNYTESVVIEQDINTLQTFTEERPSIWHKNRIVRSLQYLVNSLSRIWHLHYIGKMDNNSIGRDLFKVDLITLMRSLVEQGAFENFDAETDIIVEKGEKSDSVIVTMSIQPVDAMEKMYFTIEVQ